MILKETGWTMHYLYWKISWINVQMMLADAPGFKKASDEDEKVKGTTAHLKAMVKSQKTNG